MPVIKHNHVATSTASPFSMRDIEQQAQELVSRSRQAAEGALSRAQRDAESIRKQAREDGRAEGYAAGVAQGMAEGKAEGLQRATEEGHAAGREAGFAEVGPQMMAAHSALVLAMTQIDASRHDLEQAATAEVVQLALAIARRVVKRQAAIDPDVLAANLSDALSLAVRAADIRVVVHPDQKQTIEQELPRLKLEWTSLNHVELVGDPSITPGGCRVLTRGGGEIDARIETQLDRIIAELMPAKDEGVKG
jgi:flagellar biosynthesis/type III secretory pathway protein FliH